MSEYRIKAKSADHRKAIIGALKGLGFKESNYNPGCDFPDWPVVGISTDTVHIVFWGIGGITDATYTSLDSLIEDIIRALQTVDVQIGENIARVRDDKILFADSVDFLRIADIDRIAEAVAKVRKP